MTDLTIDNLMSLLPELFLPQHAQGVNAVINFDLSGDGGGEWGVLIQNQRCIARPGMNAAPSLTLQAAAKDILDIFTGRLDPTRALLFGKVKMTGDMRLAMKLVELFDTHDSRLRQWKK